MFRVRARLALAPYAVRDQAPEHKEETDYRDYCIHGRVVEAVKILFSLHVHKAVRVRVGVSVVKAVKILCSLHVHKAVRVRVGVRDRVMVRVRDGKMLMLLDIAFWKP